MKGEDIAARLLDFAARIIRLANELPKSTVGKHICLQITRAGTSAGANYEEARGAESKADFVHKMGISLKELRETRYWLNIIMKTALVSPKRMSEIFQETDALCRILGKSIITARERGSSQEGP